MLQRLLSRPFKTTSLEGSLTTNHFHDPFSKRVTQSGLSKCACLKPTSTALFNIDENLYILAPASDCESCAATHSQFLKFVLVMELCSERRSISDKVVYHNLSLPRFSSCLIDSVMAMIMTSCSGTFLSTISTDNFFSFSSQTSSSLSTVSLLTVSIVYRILGYDGIWTSSSSNVADNDSESVLCIRIEAAASSDSCKNFSCRTDQIQTTVSYSQQLVSPLFPREHLLLASLDLYQFSDNGCDCFLPKTFLCHICGRGYHFPLGDY